MNTISTFVHECLASGGLLVGLAATLVLPIVTWLLTRPALIVLRGEGAPHSRAIVFATLATAPGLSFALGTLTIAIAGYRAGCLHWAGGRAIVAGILVFFSAFVLRALLRAYQRQAEIRNLLAVSRIPGGRIASLAQSAGVEVRLVANQDPILCLVGFRRPLILVSEGSVARLSEAELRASFAHELAHAQHLDQVLMMLVAFFADLFPLPVDDLVERYRIAREFAADRAAVCSVDTLDLVNAIYRLSLPRAGARGAALAEQGVPARIRALLDPNRAHDKSIVRNVSMLIAGQVLVALSFVALIVPLSTCRMVS